MVAEVAWEAEEGAAAHTHHTLPHIQRARHRIQFRRKGSEQLFDIVPPYTPVH